MDRQVQKRCGTCGGRGRYTPIWSTDERRCDNCAGTGQALGTETFWSSQAGYVTAEAKNVLRENFDAKALGLRCGDRQFSVDSHILDVGQTADFTSILPISTSKASGQEAAQQAVENALYVQAHTIASRLGRVRDLQIVNVQIQNLESETWLYPVYLGFYRSGTEQLPIQLDGITKKLWVDVPSSVKVLRRKDTIEGPGS